MKLNTTELKSYLIIALGLAIYSFGWTAFLIPSKIIGGGVSGIGTLIFYSSGETIPVGLSYLIINCFLIVIALKILGPKFGAKTIYAIILGAFFLSVQQEFFTEPLVDDKFMCAIIGGILGGVGVGITISQGGSSGGTDIIAMIINKYRNISPGRVILYFDVFIIASSYIFFNDVPTIVYGYVFMGVASYAIDMVISGSKQSAQMFIITKDYEKVADEIGLHASRGISIIDATGWYSKENKKILMVVVRKHETPLIFKIVKHYDPDAFISMGSVMGVYGFGFDEIRA
ncbi:YitT family protein [Ancylomarina sp. 16SWW S1-10-2]|uniref:YitT family protein n=1 Tax=Ancylomarina sp. 16SWW S1-10-2 TaxID=2499681 RepID=UPI0012AD50D9|nr:YitT family protein [Ancylomarina sp. 16SWW S1-10-2]MRT94163.1 YitT family protein [Ancylomarina sp. 16SWW S1-10-2]